MSKDDIFTEQEDLVAIIDGDFILYVANNGNKILDDKGNPIKENNKFVYIDKSLEEVYATIDSIINDIFNNTNCTHFIGALSNGSSFRYRVYPKYKANREAYRKEITYINESRSYLMDKYGFVHHYCLEADDIVNIYKGKIPNSFIVSPDKDLLNLEGRSYNPMKKQFSECSKEQARYNFWMSMLVGDTSDNIKGIPGIGVVKANSIINELEPFGMSEQAKVLEAYIDKLGEYKGVEEFYINYKCLKLLETSEDYSLVEPCPFNVKEIRDRENVKTKEY